MVKYNSLNNPQPVRLNQSLVWFVWLGLLTWLLTACSGSAERQPTLMAPEAVFTSAAQTAEARRLERFSHTATLPAEALIETSTFSTPTPTSEPTIAATLAATMPQVSPPAAGGDRAEFVGDVTVPDGTAFTPNQLFEKTWRISNAGTTTWTPEFALVYIDGALMGAEPVIPLATTVAPGERLDIKVNMVAPPDVGGYRGYWKLRNEFGQVFGFGANGDEAIWVDIVVESGQVAVARSTTPVIAGAVSAISLTVDAPQVNGTCPHTFVFTARLSLSRPATVNYTLEAGSISGASIRLPLPATQNLNIGEHSVIYEITVPADARAWARLHVTQPVELFSNQVDFLLTCD